MTPRISKWPWNFVPPVIIALALLICDRGAIAQSLEETTPSVQNEICTHARGSAGKRRIRIDDYSCVKEPSDARISKDGKHIAYLVDGALYDIPVDGQGNRTPRILSEQSNSSPVWSQDDEAVYFLSSVGTATKLEKVSISRNRELSQIACMNYSTDVLKLSPDETRLLLELDSQQESLTEQILLSPSECSEPAAKEPEEKAEESESEPIVITGLSFKTDGNGYLASEKSNRIYALDISQDISQAPVTQLTHDSEEATEISHDTEAAWSPNGARIAFIREYPSTLEYHSEVWVAPSKGGGALENLTPWPRAERRSPSWSTDGKLIGYLWSDARHGPFAVAQLAIYSLEDGREKILTATLDRPIVSFRFSADGRFIYFIYADEGGNHLARIQLRDDKIEHLIQGEQLIAEADVSGNGYLAIIMKEMNNASDLYVVKPGEKPKRLTDLNSRYFEGLMIAQKEKVLLEDEDGMRMEVFVTKPPNFDSSRKYPTVLNIHGGPSDEQHSYGFGWFPQFLAANGYLVVEPNPPGSYGRGQSNVRKTYRNWGCTDYPAVLLAIDYVIAIGLADPQKLGVTGYSYGGYMTNCIITRTPRKFKAAASGAGHSLIVANYGPDTWLKWYKWELGTPWQNRENFERLSPLNGVGYVQTPTLFLSGEVDGNVPILNSELFYLSLRVKGVQTQLVVYPDTNHTDWSEDFSKDYYQRVLDWLDSHLNR